MMNTRGIIFLFLLALLCFAASKIHAEERPIVPRHQSPGPTTCEVVRQFVAMVGPEQAEKLARDGGASEARIAAARRCMKDVK